MIYFSMFLHMDRTRDSQALLPQVSSAALISVTSVRVRPDLSVFTNSVERVPFEKST